MSRCNKVFIAGGSAALLLAPVQPYATPTPEYHYGVIVETVNNYKACFGNGSDLSNSNQSGADFLNQLTRYPYFSMFAHWQDANVWDRDFLDPDTYGAKWADDDTYSFDEPGLAVSFFQGHGLASTKPASDQVCTSGSQCTHPPSGASVGNLGTGTCVLSPASVAKYGKGNGVCQYTSNRAMVTCGSNDANGHLAYLSPNMAFGENPTNGAWRHAGTNGGTSLAIVHMSFGMLTFFPSEWSDIFAGLHLYEGLMVSWGDVNDSAGFGNAVASPYTVNPNSSVTQGYLNAISSVTDGDGSCSPGGSSWNGGFNGCGCHAAMTLSNSADGAWTRFNEPWLALRNDWPSQSGVGYWWWGIGCNYDPTTYPWSGGDRR
jgi:hypothetical protein